MFRQPSLALLILVAISAAGPASALELHDCRISAGPGHPGIKARCGTLLRPLNPDDPASDQLELSVAVVPALNLNPEPDPLVPIAGGPGQGSIQFYSALARAFEGVRRERDILLMDQRGTGGSARMNCPIDDAVVEGPFSSAVTVEYTQSCLAQLPHDPRYFTTSVAVSDLEALRLALGYPSLNLLGVSYGTRVAQHYARRYPSSTRSLVLDGVLPPQVPLGPGIALEAQRALDNILARCADDAACNRRFPDIQGSFASLLVRLTDAPADVEFSDPTTGQSASLRFGRNEFAAAIRLLAYNARSIAIIPLLVDEAEKGNFSPLAALFQMTVGSLMDSLAIGMHNAVVCTEDVPFIDNSSFDYEELKSTYIGAFQLETLEAICSVWPTGPLDDGFAAPLATDIPVLLLSGEADPITPPRFAELAAVDLERARHLIGEKQGHGQLANGCMPDIIADFVAAADPDAIDADCLMKTFVMPFFLDYSGPSP